MTRWLPWGAGAAVLAASLHAWQTSNRINGLEAELVRRQDISQSRAQEALLLAKQSQDMARDTSARTALLDAKLADVALQRTQIDTLVQSLNRSRDENLLADMEASLRVAMQQSALTGSAEPLVSALHGADERLARAQQPRLDNVRRALIKDLGELRDTRIADLPTLAIRLDEAIRLVDELPLLAQASATAHAHRAAPTPQTKAARGATGTAPKPAPADLTPWPDRLVNWSHSATQSAWQEAKTLIRVTRIGQPEAALLAPDQSYFLKENLKLRLLNARLSLMSRQTETALSDLQSTSQVIDRYFDQRARKTTTMRDLLRDVALQAKQVQIPRPDDTLAAISTLSGTP
jgi:uroporphyrin-3 C-methyltransferase